jgi:hypothetical protein
VTVGKDDLGRMPVSSDGVRAAGWYLGLGLIAVADAISQVASAIRERPERWPHADQPQGGDLR